MTLFLWRLCECHGSDTGLMSRRCRSSLHLPDIVPVPSRYCARVNPSEECLPTDLMSSSHHDREQISKAREAAEALFRPKEPRATGSAPAAAPIASSLTADRAARAPRVFAVPQAKPEDDDPITQVPKPRRAKTQKRSAKLSPSDHARIRTLTDYGMSVEQVAEHYGLPAEGIERILAELKARE
jgi:hypothetical protein